MALTAYLQLQGSRQGKITGSVVQKGREGRIAVLESNHELGVASDADTGLASGRLQHRPFVVVKEIDRATPQLYQALIDNETFSQFELQYFARGARAGGTAELNRYTVRLTGAHLLSIRFVHPDVLDPAMQHFPEAEELSFGYQRIEWLWTQPASSAGDDWAHGPRVLPAVGEAPVAGSAAGSALGAARKRTSAKRPSAARAAAKSGRG